MVQFFDGLGEVPPGFGPAAVTVGKFDGLHLGHRNVLRQLREMADRRGLLDAVVTFDRNPLSLLSPENCPVPLVSNAQKRELLEQSGVDATLMLHFDAELAAQAPEFFVESVLVDALHARVVLCGADFRFGSHGSGDVELLRRLGARHGFEVVILEDVRAEDAGASRRTSSTWVRELLGQGRVRDAAELLGRLPSIRSTVVHGEQRGRELGYPTANLDPDIEGYLPLDGVYATWVIVDGARYGAATSIGNNPTFEGVPQHQVETHLFDQRLDLYDRPIGVQFVEYLRPMNRFDSVESLVAQLHRDDERIRVILAAEPPAVEPTAAEPTAPPASA
ncbi:MAG: bifunctional riboflavin kinase/FAD synthetase [Actinomycetota bacterium]|nr:bifunctional riboflavin kinase/FAD synthetase [Actinomycetota bacterium]